MAMTKKCVEQGRAEFAAYAAPGKASGAAAFGMPSGRGRGAGVEPVALSSGERAESGFAAFAARCGTFAKSVRGIRRGRSSLAGQREVFWTGASLKDAGRLTFAAAKMGAEVVPGLPGSIRKTTAERREYGKGQEGGVRGWCKGERKDKYMKHIGFFMENCQMKALLDTNIIIRREAATDVSQDIGLLYRWLDKGRYLKCVHSATIDEIKKNPNTSTASSFLAEQDSYETIEIPSPIQDAVAEDAPEQVAHRTVRVGEP